MRNVRIDDIDHVTRAVIAIGTDYPPGHLLPMHSHRRAQLLYGATGVMHVFTQQGNWVVPPQHAVWLPPQMPHAVRWSASPPAACTSNPARCPQNGRRSASGQRHPADAPAVDGGGGYAAGV